MKSETQIKINIWKIFSGFVCVFGFLWAGSVNAQELVNKAVTKAEETIIETDLSAAPAAKQKPIAKEGKKNVEVTVVETEIGAEQAKEAESLPKLPVALKNGPQAAGKTETVAPAAEKVSGDKGIEVQGKQIVQISASLRRIIEENEKLRQENQALDSTLRTLRGQTALDTNRASAALKERDAYKQEVDRIATVNAKFQKDMEDLRTQLMEKEKWLNERGKVLEQKMSETEQAKLNAMKAQLPEAEQKLADLKTGLAGEKENAKRLEDVAAVKLPARETPAGAPKNPAASASPVVLAQDKEKSRKVMAMLDSLSSTNEKIKTDEAKVHYNMGNVFFHQGHYRRAASEYKQAVELNPSDSSAHFNLAFVSSEYLNDYKTALENYKQYLDLNPQAEDANLVHEKILDAEINVRNVINSPLEKDVLREKNKDQIR